MRFATELQTARVVGFGTEANTTAIGFGAAAWWLLLTLLFAGNIVAGASVWDANGYDAVVGLVGCLLVVHMTVGVAMIVDAWKFHHRMWPLTTVVFAGNLFNVAALASILGYAFALSDDQRGARVTFAAATLFAQVVFVASANAVTLEFLARK